jgi:hypothetical protein
VVGQVDAAETVSGDLARSRGLVHDGRDDQPGLLAAAVGQVRHRDRKELSDSLTVVGEASQG